MPPTTLFDERKKNLVDALSFREPQKIPVGAEILSWPLSYAGIKYCETYNDPKKIAEAYVKFLEVIKLDYYWGGMISRPYRTYQALGCYSYDISSDGNTIAHLQPNIEFMSADEYPELIADPLRFQDKQLKKRCKVLQLSQEEAYKEVKRALIEFRPYVATNKLIRKYFYEKEILQLVDSPIRFDSPISAIFDRFRGMRDTLVDIRRRPDKIREACASLQQLIKEELEKLDINDHKNPYPLGFTGYHAECFLSPTLFDEFFFEPFKELFLPFMEAGKKIFLKGEGTFINTVDRYRQLPKGSVLLMLDQDDPFEIYKIIGDWQPLATGITSDLLKLGTKDQCIDFVKKCFDTFAPGGGFIFMPNKPLLSAGDVKIENLIAVYETANELSLK